RRFIAKGFFFAGWWGCPNNSALVLFWSCVRLFPPASTAYGLFPPPVWRGGAHGGRLTARYSDGRGGSGWPSGGFPGFLCLIKLPGLLFQLRSLFRGHLREVVHQAIAVWCGVLKTRRHVDALGGAGEGAQITVAALGHVNVELP